MKKPVYSDCCNNKLWLGFIGYDTVVGYCCMCDSIEIHINNVDKISEPKYYKNRENEIHFVSKCCSSRIWLSIEDGTIKGYCCNCNSEIIIKNNQNLKKLQEMS